MRYSSIYTAYASKIDPDRAFRSEKAAAAYDKSQALNILQQTKGADWEEIINSPNNECSLSRAVKFLAEFLDDAPRCMPSAEAAS